MRNTVPSLDRVWALREKFEARHIGAAADHFRAIHNPRTGDFDLWPITETGRTFLADEDLIEMVRTVQEE